MRELAERAWFLACLTSGRLLRSGKYSRTRIDVGGGEREVRKHRLAYAPLLIWLGGPLMRILATGVRVLPQRDWEERERLIYRSLHGASIRIDARGTLVLPRLSGRTLADLLDDRKLGESLRARAIELAVVSLARFHRLGLTHGDAMAENVMVDLEAGVAHWFDFETIHQSGRPAVWRRADDVRALLSTCLLRTDPARQAGTLDLILSTYADETVTPHVAASFQSIVHRPLAFHLGQAGLSLQHFRAISHLLRQRLGEQAASRH